MSSDRRRPVDWESLISLKIDNLSSKTSTDQLRKWFDKFGEIGDVYIPRDPYGKESNRGYGFVRFYDYRDAEDAADSMDRTILDGREIKVQLARHNRSNKADFLKNSRRNYHRRCGNILLTYIII
ncbi:hypothetical protein HELRODRAFT_87714 [Helobdella robusta]|uniref:RRM domain-containing protein n=1 Tax=Helobdella robusta TaxID=6412 RepID=T1G6U7_HELRO|nr:hypothetical protein HELRODRAFT_87714 [Helobdella robusta]ESN94058.1 hypothetical protein HELRODRAFT_87714 [Helobdella robusta]